MLNVTQDHLDWHGTMAAYAAAKARVFGSARDDGDQPRRRRWSRRWCPPPVAGQGARRGKPRRAVEREVVRFGLDAPRAPGDFGLVVENGMAWLVRALRADETAQARREGRADEPRSALQRLMPADALRVRGRHNAANALAALALADRRSAARSRRCCTACASTAASRTASSPSRTIDGVDAFDDSKGTNVGATVAALNGLGADRAPAKLVVILGGDGKGQDFTPLAEPLRRHARAVATIGRDAARDRGGAGADRRAAAAPRDARGGDALVLRAGAQPGDAVLLSPACASLDMFRNYAHRAEVFVAEVQALAAEHGGWRMSLSAAAGFGALRARPGCARPRRRRAAAERATQARRARRSRCATGSTVGSGQPARLLGFDQTLVWVVVALLALGLVMVYSRVGRAARQPEVRALRARPTS